jgi:hypothetical protein
MAPWSQCLNPLPIWDHFIIYRRRARIGTDGAVEATARHIIHGLGFAGFAFTKAVQQFICCWIEEQNENIDLAKLFSQRVVLLQKYNCRNIVVAVFGGDDEMNQKLTPSRHQCQHEPCDRPPKRAGCTTCDLISSLTIKLIEWSV